jgi:hypothetical protein
MKERSALYDRIRQILESARTNVARTVNSTQVVANWLIGREIVEEEQKGKKWAGYGEELIAELSEKLQKEFGVGYGTTNLKLFRQFFLSCPSFLRGRMGHTRSDPSLSRGKKPVPTILAHPIEMSHTACDPLWEPGLLHPNLYYDRERRTERDGPTLGLILCTDKNDAVVRYTLGPDQQKKIFASRCKLHLPTEAELQAELRRELRQLGECPESGSNSN